VETVIESLCGKINRTFEVVFVEVLRGSGVDDEGLGLRGLEVVVQVTWSTKGVVHVKTFTTKIIHAGRRD